MKLFYLLVVLILPGCAFVQLSEAGAGVAQLSTGNVANCKEIGEVSTQTRDKVLISRGQEVVREELTILARNEAAGLGANAIVPIAIPVEGKQRFRAYLCE